MNRIDKKFAELKTNNKKGLITFLTAGDPDAEKSLNLLASLPEAGADLIEIGMPFTDPMADGPAIQAAGLRALDHGMSVKKTLELVQNFREKNTETPIILMGYFNPIYIYGTEKFVKDAAHAGVDGMIIVDLPPEEDKELRPLAEKENLCFVKLITPTSNEERLEKILNSASGFLYYVSITGITGTKSANIDEVGNHINIIREKTDLPIAVGFGIKTPDDAKKMSGLADAIVVGSSLVQTIESNQNDPNLTSLIEQQVSSLKEAI